MHSPDKPEEVVRGLTEALNEYLAQQDEYDWCQRLKYHHCSSLKCLVAGNGGTRPVPPFSYDLATCPRYRLEQARAHLQKGNPDE